MAQGPYDQAFARKAAESYERNFVPAIGAPVAARLIEAAALRPGERVLDVACGTGIVSRLAADRVGDEGSVAGLDPNPAMLEVARNAPGGEGRIDWHEAAAEAMPLEDESFDVVLCGMGLQFFSDRAAGLAEIHRVLVPGGRLLANVPGPAPPPLKAMAEGLSRHAGPECASFVNRVFSLHDGDELRRLAKEAGFRRVEVGSEETALDLGNPGDFLWNYVGSTPMAARVEEIGEERRAALERDFTQRCRPYMVNGILQGAVRMSTLEATK